MLGIYTFSSIIYHPILFTTYNFINFKAMTDTTRKVFFRVGTSTYLDEYGDFTEKDILWFRLNQGVLMDAVNIMRKCTNSRCELVNREIIKALVYTKTREGEEW